MIETIKDRLRIIYNNDEGVINFLADLSDRNPINVIQQGLKEDKKIRACIVNYHDIEGIATLLLCNDPFGYNENGNILMLFAHSKFKPIIEYFERWLRDTSYEEKDKRTALLTIIKMLYITKERTEYKQTQTNSMG